MSKIKQLAVDIAESIGDSELVDVYGPVDNELQDSTVDEVYE